MEPLMIGILALTAFAAIPLLIWFFQWLWNITMPDVFNVATITFWQAFRLLLIAAFLFGTGRSGG